MLVGWLVVAGSFADLPVRLGGCTVCFVVDRIVVGKADAVVAVVVPLSSYGTPLYRAPQNHKTGTSSIYYPCA